MRKPKSFNSDLNSQISLLPALMEYATESRAIELMSHSEETSSQQETSADAIIAAATGVDEVGPRNSSQRINFLCSGEFFREKATEESN